MKRGGFLRDGILLLHKPVIVHISYISLASIDSEADETQLHADIQFHTVLPQFRPLRDLIPNIPRFLSSQDLPPQTTLSMYSNPPPCRQRRQSPQSARTGPQGPAGTNERTPKGSRNKRTTEEIPGIVESGYPTGIRDVQGRTKESQLGNTHDSREVYLAKGISLDVGEADGRIILGFEFVWWLRCHCL